MLRLLCLCCVALLPALSQAEIRVSDTRGEVVLDAPPSRVVALEFSFADALATLGLSPVGVADDGDAERLIAPIRADLDAWTSVGARSQPSLEVIASLKPELIIADAKRHATVVEDLRQIAPTLLLESYGATYADSLQSHLTIAAALGREAEMAERLAAHEALMDDYAARFAGALAEGDTVLFAISSAKGIYLHGPHSYAGGVIARLGLDSPIPDATEQAYIPATLERLAQADPDYLIVGEYDDESVIDTFAQSPLWPLMTAIRHGHYAQRDPHLWAQNRGLLPAERMAEELAALLDTRLAGTATQH
ncbi:Fe(3+)-dicitrate ABC transporter substrate-binding protein FecB [Billgrantia azerbaijanica]|nr:Fe(3+)-dicitrate ABC transporter substrate-binding protein FecB [Halomonas azerbaijanica]